MARFPQFDAQDYLERGNGTLGALGTLDAKILPFQKKVQALDDETRERYEERAAIMEYDGGKTAEKLAYAEIIEINFRRDRS